ncbi:MAG: hypothetical protein KDA84_27545, partial [Planctomycetaceae bacterium]|nr:hypothetical protein [Planctomycetaceae bacterium]
MAFLGCVAALVLAWGANAKPQTEESAKPATEKETRSNQPSEEQDRSPVDVALSPDGSWLVTANETSDSVSLVDVRAQKVLAEIPVEDHPSFITLCPDGHTALVSCGYAGKIVVLNVADGQLERLGTIPVGFDPCGIAVAPKGNSAFIGLTATGEVAEVNWKSFEVVRKFEVGAWPRYLALSPDGKRLMVGIAGESKVVTFDVTTGKPLHENPMTGAINFGHIQSSSDGQYAYVPWMVYRSNPISVRNIRLGW